MRSGWLWGSQAPYRSGLTRHARLRSWLHLDVEEEGQQWRRLWSYLYTAIDYCSRFQVLSTYPRRNAKSTIDFLKQLIEEMPFAIQRIQTDRRQDVQNRLRVGHQVSTHPAPPIADVIAAYDLSKEFIRVNDRG